MRAAAAASPGHARIVLRAAHDTVLAPLASVLRFQGSGPAWPGYAARIAFELWEAPEATGEEGEEGRAGRWLVRVLYQGADVTARLPCASPAPSSPAGTAAATCSLEGFEAVIEGLLLLRGTAGVQGAPAPRSWAEACGAEHDDESVREP